MLPLPVPASVYGLVLLLAALNFGFVKLDDVKEVGIYLTGIFPLLFVPAAAGVMEPNCCSPPRCPAIYL